MRYGAGWRGIYLLRGEALFTVTPGPYRSLAPTSPAVCRVVCRPLEGTRDVAVTVAQGAVDVIEISGAQTAARDGLTEDESSPASIGRLEGWPDDFSRNRKRSTGHPQASPAARAWVSNTLARFTIADQDAVLDVLQTNFGIHYRRAGEHCIRLKSQQRR